MLSLHKIKIKNLFFFAIFDVQKRFTTLFLIVDLKRLS